MSHWERVLTERTFYLKDIWFTNNEVSELVNKGLSPEIFKEKYEDIFSGGENWKQIKAGGGETYHWRDDSTYVQRPPYFKGISFDLPALRDIVGARPLAILGNSVTTDHISPAGVIGPSSSAGEFLQSKGIDSWDLTPMVLEGEIMK